MHANHIGWYLQRCIIFSILSGILAVLQFTHWCKNCLNLLWICNVNINYSEKGNIACNTQFHLLVLRLKKVSLYFGCTVECSLQAISFTFQHFLVAFRVLRPIKDNLIRKLIGYPNSLAINAIRCVTKVSKNYIFD